MAELNLVSMASAEDDALQTKNQVNDIPYQKYFLKCLNNLRKGGQFTDFTLIASEQRIPCHKVVLAAASQYFLGMFNSGMEESASDSVTLHDTDLDALKLVINYAYTASIEITVTNIQSLVQTCDKLEFTHLKAMCEKFLLKQVQPSNSLSLYMFSRLYSLPLVEKKACENIMNNLKEVVKSSHTSEYQAFTEVELLRFINDDSLVTKDENFVFQFLLKWTYSSLEERKERFRKLISHVRLGFCTSKFLCGLVEKEPLMEFPECQVYLHEAKNFMLEGVCHYEIVSPRTRPRQSYGAKRCLLAIGGLKEDDSNKCTRHHVHVVDAARLTPGSLCRLNENVPPPNSQSQVIRHGACVLANAIVLHTGGTTVEGNEVSQECIAYKLKGHTLGEKMIFPSMIERRVHHATVCQGTEAFALGGLASILPDNYRTPLSSAEKIAVRIPSGKICWLAIPNMLKAVFGHVAVTYGHQIYVMGGNGVNAVASLTTQVYDTGLEEWTLMADMPKTCTNGAAVRYNDQIFVVGSLECCCMSFTPAVDNWTNLSQPMEQHQLAPAVVWKGKIVLGGGRMLVPEESTTKCETKPVSKTPPKYKTTGCIEEYDPETDTWIKWENELKFKLSDHFFFNIQLPNM